MNHAIAGETLEVPEVGADDETVRLAGMDDHARRLLDGQAFDNLRQLVQNGA